MEKGLKKIGLGLVAVGLSIVLLLIGAIPVCEAGRDEKVVGVGLYAYWTGPLASSGASINPSTIDYARLLNERGGLDGVRI